MLGRLRRRVTYANGMSTIAVFLAVGGTSYAAMSLPAASVGTKQLKQHAVTLKKIDVAAQHALKGAAGPQGAAGPPGVQGTRGPTGSPGPKGDSGASGGFGPTFGTTVSGGSDFMDACKTTTLASTTFTLKHPGMVYMSATGTGVDANGSTVNSDVGYTFALQTGSASTPVSEVTTNADMSWTAKIRDAPLPSGGIMPTADGSPYVASPGTYTAELTAEAYGTCGSTNLFYGPAHLSVIEVGTGS